MTNFDLLSYIGNVDDRYIMDSRKKPKKKAIWPKVVPAVIAAVLILAVMTTCVKYLFADGLGSNVVNDETASAPAEAPAEGALDEEAAPAEPPTAGEEENITVDAEPTTEEAPAPTPLLDLDTYDGVTTLANVTYPQSIAYDDYDAKSKVWQENQITDDTAYAMNAFGYKTAAAVLKDSETSGCYSPLSLYQTLSILASGAEGETREEILSLLGISDLETLAQESGKLYRVNYADNEVNLLRISNSLWLDSVSASGSPINYNQDWVLSAAANYYADVYSAEFENPETSQALGAWIADRTGGMLNPEFNFDADTVMAIVNTLWFKTQWAQNFHEENTSEDTFTLSSGDTVTCDFMHRTEDVGSYVQGEGYIKSSLHLDRGKMIIVLPDEGQDIETFLTEEKLWEIFENADYQEAEVRWSMPKFETDATYDLTEVLTELGITAAFDLTKADFTTIAQTEDPLYLGYVQQGTHIAVNEEGVEAAAYTIATLAEGAAAPSEEPKIIEMDLSRPFLYLITANDGSTLFIGVVRNPLE